MTVTSPGKVTPTSFVLPRGAKIAVIGAGAAGLITARNLRDLAKRCHSESVTIQTSEIGYLNTSKVNGINEQKEASGKVCSPFLGETGDFSVTVFEQNAQVGGTWIYEEVQSNVVEKSKEWKVVCDPESQMPVKWHENGRFDHAEHNGQAKKPQSSTAFEFAPSDLTGADHQNDFHSSMYWNLHTNLPKEVMPYLNEPFPASLPSYISHQDVCAYLQNFAIKHKLHESIRFNTKVLSVAPHESGRGWVVKHRRVFFDKTKDMTAKQQMSDNNHEWSENGCEGDGEGKTGNGGITYTSGKGMCPRVYGSGGSNGGSHSTCSTVSSDFSTTSDTSHADSRSGCGHSNRCSGASIVHEDATARNDVSSRTGASALFQPPTTRRGTKEKQTVSTFPTRTASEDTHEFFDAVAVCNGHYSVPRLPSLPGLSGFPGLFMHAHYYRKPDYFKNKFVVVVGAGPSGVDIAIELAEGYARKVYLSHSQDERIRLERYASLHQCAPIERVGGDGRIAFSDGTVSEEAVDVILACTGYLYDFPFLRQVKKRDTQLQRRDCSKHRVASSSATSQILGENHVEYNSKWTGTEADNAATVKEESKTKRFAPGQTPYKRGEVCVEDNMVRPLYRHLFHCADPTLTFLGLPFRIVPFPFFDYQSRFMAAVFTGRASLPSTEEMESIRLKEERERLVDGGGAPERYFHCFGEYQWEYERQLVRGVDDESLMPPLEEMVIEIYNDGSQERKKDPARYRHRNFHVTGDGWTVEEPTGS